MLYRLPFPKIIKTYSGCLSGTYSIKVDENIQPVIHPPRKIPIALRDTVKDELDRMEREGVIVKQREPTRLVNAMPW